MNEKLIEARQAAGYKSQSEAAEAIGIPQPKLSEYERGTSVPSVERAEKIVRSYGRTLEQCGWEIVAGPHVVKLTRGEYFCSDCGEGPIPPQFVEDFCCPGCFSEEPPTCRVIGASDD